MKPFLVIILIFASVCFKAQKYKFGKVSKEEIEQPSCKLNPDAEAAILYQDTRFYIQMGSNNYSLVEETFVRIKIYDKDLANDWLSYTFNLYKNSSQEEIITNFKAATYNIDNGSIEEIGLKKSDAIIDNESDYKSTFSFNFPNVKNGSVLEYKYNKISPFLHTVDETYFQYTIPMLNAKYIFQYPEYFNYKLIKNGILAPNSQQTNNITTSGESMEVVESFDFKNVNPRKKEEFVINDDNLREGISYELSGITIPGYVYENYSQTWDGVFKTLRTSNEFGEQLRFSNFFKKIIEPLVSGMDNNDEKAWKILNYVQNEISWNGRKGIFSNGVKKAYNDKKGNAADINLMVVNMLTAAGINAFPVILSSPGNGYVNPVEPTITKFNYVVASYKIGSQYMLLDATSPFSNINVVPERALGLNGFVVTEDNYEIIQIVNSNQSKEYYKVQGSLEGNKISGKYQKIVNNYFAISESESYYSDKKSYIEELKSTNDATIDNIEIERNDDKFYTDFNFNFTKEVEIVGDKILFNPLLFLANEKQVFNEESRRQNIEFGSPFSISKSVMIKIPENYSVEELPEETAISLPQGSGKYFYSIKESNGNIIISSKMTFNQSVYPSSAYAILKEFYQKTIESETQYVSLMKN